MWEVGYRGRVVTVRAFKGLAALPRSRRRGRAGGRPSPVIDADARRAYETRIRDLQEDFDDAEPAWPE